MYKRRRGNGDERLVCNFRGRKLMFRLIVDDLSLTLVESEHN